MVLRRHRGAVPAFEGVNFVVKIVSLVYELVVPQSFRCHWYLGLLVGCFVAAHVHADDHPRAAREDLWALESLRLPDRGEPEDGSNLIDTVLDLEQRRQGIAAYPPADRLTWLRRVSFDLVGLAPTIMEQEAFLEDRSESAYETVVDRLLADSQHGVRYARHWLDLLRYADVDERMPAGTNLYLWRDWVIRALNRNLPYDAFVRTQISGLEVRERTSINALGYRSQRQPRLDNMFALGYLARGATSKGNGDHALAMAAVETTASAFLGMTVACAKCHDHFYDPISQEDYYRMKALFDPLILRDVPLATVPQIVQYGQDLRTYEQRKKHVDEAVASIEAPYRERLYEERVQMLTAEIQSIIRKTSSERTPEEQKIADDYFPVLRIDVGKIREVMPKDVVVKYDAVREQLKGLKRPRALPSFLTVEEDPKRREVVRYVLNSGEASRPETERVVKPGFLFEPEGTEFNEGLRETFVDWLTDKENLLFGRVVVNRIWQWHFGKGLHEKANDFGSVPAEPRLRSLLDGLVDEFLEHDFDMKWLHKRIVLSAAYRRASAFEGEGYLSTRDLDPGNEYYWRFPLRRLEAEPIHDSLLALADRLDLSEGGPSYDVDEESDGPQRRGVYLKRGFRSQENRLPVFLQAFDARDGRESCDRREQTVTAPQALWFMNNSLVHKSASAFAERLDELSRGELLQGIEIGFRMALGRRATASEIQMALTFMEPHPNSFDKLAWMLVNLDEFIYIR